jgi:hypothetical protein
MPADNQLMTIDNRHKPSATKKEFINGIHEPAHTCLKSLQSDTKSICGGPEPVCELPMLYKGGPESSGGFSV